MPTNDINRDILVDIATAAKEREDVIHDSVPRIIGAGIEFLDVERIIDDHNISS
jgi:hypothetical protein